MKKLTILLFCLVSFVFCLPPNENELCWEKFTVNYKKKVYPRMDFYRVCINGYSYTGSVDKDGKPNGLTQDFEIYSVESGVFLPRICSCSQ